jgi:hypothetical protein
VAHNSDLLPGRSVGILLFSAMFQMTGLWGKVDWSVKIKYLYIALRFNSPVLEL